jgi:hypothetical protein
MKLHRSFVKIGKGLLWVCQLARFWVNSSWGSYALSHVHIDGDLSSLGANICILAVHSKTGKALPSTLGLIRAIKRQGYDLVVVVNGRNVALDWFEGEISERDVLITRPNLGRDFAAYQLATNFLFGKKICVERLLYCNDSIFYLDKNDPKNIFGLLASSKDSWIGMTENYPVYHVSSWCFQLSSEILASRAFINFWKTYQPVDSHRHAVTAGEEKLTSVLLKAGYRPRIVFDAASLLKAVLQTRKDTDQKSVWHQLQPLICGIAPTCELTAILTALFQGERTNQANKLAILLISELGFPFIKKKLVRQTNFPRSLLVLILEKFMTGFCAETVHEIRLTGARLRA